MATPEEQRALPGGSIPKSRIQLVAGSVAVTDLHLAPFADERCRRFAAWCDGLEGVPSLLILGDLFDAWVGRCQLRLDGSEVVLGALRRLSERGTEVHFVPGNRDALVDGAVSAVSGMVLHPEGFIAEIDGHGDVAFVHGDALCTLDHGYLRLRRLWARPSVRWLSRHAPLAIARRVGARLRRYSEDSKPRKVAEAKAIRPLAVATLAGLAGVETVVTGHAHIARDGDLGQLEAGTEGLSDREASTRWVVLGAWGTPLDLLCLGADGLHFGDSPEVAMSGGSELAAPGA